MLAVATIRLVQGPQRWWAIACSALLSIATALAVPAQRELWRVQHEWDDWRRAAAIHGLNALRRAIDDAVERSDQMLEEIFVTLAARAEHVRAPEEHVARPVDGIVGIEAGGLQLA